MIEIKFHQIQSGDIFGIKENKYNYLCIKKEHNLIVSYNIETTEITNLFNTNSNKIYYYFDTLKNLTTVPTYYWMGIEYLKTKLLINLHTLEVESYDYKNKIWKPLQTIEELDTVLIITAKSTKFLINLDTLEVSIKKSRSIGYSPYSNFLLGEMEDYVFNSDNELVLIKPEKEV